MYVSGFRKIFINGCNVQGNSINNLEIICRKAKKLGLEIFKTDDIKLNIQSYTLENALKAVKYV
jgi:hypothetical protein